METYDEPDPGETFAPPEGLEAARSGAARRALEASGHTGCPLLRGAMFNAAAEAVVCGCGVFVTAPTELVDGKALTAGTQSLQPADPIASTLALIDPTQIYTPVQVEYHILDVVARLETGALFERDCIEKAADAQTAWNRLYFATIHTSQETSELKRKAEAEVRCDQEGLTARRDETRMLAAAIKATMHNLRAVLSGYQSTSKSVTATYQAGGSPGRSF